MEQTTALEGLLSQPFSPHIPENNHQLHSIPSETSVQHESPSNNQHVEPMTNLEADDNLVERLNEAADELLIKEYEELYELMTWLLVWAAEKLPDEPDKRRKLTAFSVFSSVISTLIFYKLTGKAINVDTELISGLIGALRTALMSMADDLVTTRVKSRFDASSDESSDPTDQPEEQNDDRAA